MSPRQVSRIDSGAILGHGAIARYMEAVEAGGASIPALGLGTWQNTGQQCAETVEAALELGYRHVDTAQAYDNEEEVGAGLAAADIHREAVFLTTKLWRSNLRAADVRSSVRASLDRLGVETVDMLLIHWPHPRIPLEETLEAMDALVDAGLVRHLGVSNFTAEQLRSAVETADHPIVTNQVLYHPFVDRSGLMSVCSELGVAVTAYSPLARGRVLDDAVLGEIGDRYDKSPAQVALRWLVQQDGVIAIPKATGRAHLDDNLAIFDFSLSDKEMARIDARRAGLVQRLRNLAPAFMRNVPL